MASSPQNLNQYLNDLESYQRKKQRKDPHNRVKLPFFRKAHNRFKSIPDHSEMVQIASSKDLHARMKRHQPYLTPANLHGISQEYLDQQFEGGGGINVVTGHSRKQSVQLPDIKSHLMSPNSFQAVLLPGTSRRSPIKMKIDF